MLTFADDIDTVAHSTRHVREAFSHLEEEAGNLGIKVNEEKTKYIVITKNPRTRIRIYPSMSTTSQCLRNLGT